MRLSVKFDGGQKKETSFEDSPYGSDETIK